MPAGTLAVYRSRKRKGSRQGWRWRTVARNGRKTGCAGEAYTNESDAFTGALVTAKIIAVANGYQLVKKG